MPAPGELITLQISQCIEQLIVIMTSVSRIVWMDSCNVDVLLLCCTAGDVRAQYLPPVCRCHLLYRLNLTNYLELCESFNTTVGTRKVINSGGCKGRFFSPNRPERLWGPPTLLSNG